MMTIPSEIVELWQQHSAAAFPKGYGSKEINQVDLPLLDAEITGCIRMYIHGGAKLDAQRIKTLRERLIDLNTVILILANEELVYFDRLRKLANLILQEVKSN
jgi:hypothetical protein